MHNTQLPEPAGFPSAFLTLSPFCQQTIEEAIEHTNANNLALQVTPLDPLRFSSVAPCSALTLSHFASGMLICTINSSCSKNNESVGISCCT